MDYNPWRHQLFMDFSECCWAKGKVNIDFFVSKVSSTFTCLVIFGQGTIWDLQGCGVGIVTLVSSYQEGPLHRIFRDADTRSTEF